MTILIVQIMFAGGFGVTLNSADWVYPDIAACKAARAAVMQELVLEYANVAGMYAVASRGICIPDGSVMS